MSSAKQHSKLDFYLRTAMAGGICASAAHTVLVPIDVVKTRIQINPADYTSFSSAVKKIRLEEGSRGLFLGFGPTMLGYIIQGGAKFGFFEFFKNTISAKLGSEKSQKYKSLVYVSSSAAAEIIGSIALCPWEAIRIRMVSQPEMFKNLNAISGTKAVYKQEGIAGLYKGLGPLCFKQLPYTITQLTVFSYMVDHFYGSVLPLVSSKRSKDDLTSHQQLAVSTSVGFVAGFISAITSHPADTVLSIINAKAKGVKSDLAARMPNSVTGILRTLGWRGVWLGLGTRCVMVGSLSAVMFLVYDTVKVMCGLPTSSGISKDKPSKESVLVPTTDAPLE
jgi:solute carrier family 25 phosphate transporter 3